MLRYVQKVQFRLVFQHLTPFQHCSVARISSARGQEVKLAPILLIFSKKKTQNGRPKTNLNHFQKFKKTKTSRQKQNKTKQKQNKTKQNKIKTKIQTKTNKQKRGHHFIFIHFLLVLKVYRAQRHSTQWLVYYFCFISGRFQRPPPKSCTRAACAPC